MNTPVNRSRFQLFLGIVIGFLLAFTAASLDDQPVTQEVIAKAEQIIGIHFTSAERDSMLDDVNAYRKDYQALRELHLPNDVPPALVFDPVPPGKKLENKKDTPNQWDLPKDVKLPANRDDLAFYTVSQLASLIKERKITSVELTKFFLNRLKTYGDTLHAVITLTEQRALDRARQMDKELAEGHYRGPLHGIPYGIKDLFAVKGYRTTWGATPYENQQIDMTATVPQKLDEAGAVLLAKLTSGALAYGDIWFGGKTRNPWNLEQGSSGSSAGPASATSAGLVPFAIGTETLGSIVSPSTRCGTTGLRPTYGRVSRYGCMALSWSMDKVGPITRSVQDAAMVFDAIHGPDGEDLAVKDMPFNYKADVDLSKLRIGYVKSAFDNDRYNKENDQRTLDKLRSMGANLVPIELPDYPVSALRFILTAEAAAAFDDLTLSNRDSMMVWQEKAAWPNTFRAARFIPAVEYIQANRARTQLMQQMDSLMQKVDVYLTPAFGNPNLLITNLTGHPSVVVPNGFNEKGSPTSITFMGRLYDEGTVLAVARKYQQATDFDEKHPPLFSN